MLPDGVSTSEPRLDAALRALDAALAGGARRRLPTLLEIKDHLLERQAEAMERGMSSDDAAAEAVQRLGDVRAIAKGQRVLVFGETARAVVVMFTAMVLLQRLDRPLLDALPGAIVGALALGSLTFWVLPLEPGPTVLSDPLARPFVVTVPIPYRVLGALLMVAAVWYGVGNVQTLASGGLRGNDVIAAIVGLAMTAFVMSVILPDLLSQPLAVDERGLRTSDETLPWSALRAVSPSFAPMRGTALEFIEDGTYRRVRVYPGARGAEQVIAAARRVLSARARGA